MTEIESTNETNGDETFAFLNILNIISDTAKFRQWLFKFHKLKDHDRFFECKLQIHDNLEKYVKQINRIFNVMKKEYPDKKIIPKLVVYYPVLEARTSEFEKKGIDIIHNFKNAIQNDRVFNGERRKLLQTLDFTLKGKLNKKYDDNWFT